MNTDLDNQQDAPESSRFGGLHVRTFEAELLISGAVVFGLFQVPPIIGRFFDASLLRLDGHLRMLAVYALTYPLMVIYGLIGAFLIHLTLRAYWIGLVGLESVFPDGIQWNRVKEGPFFVRLARRRFGRLAQMIERVDDLCSLVFSFSFMIVIVFVYSLLVIAISAIGSFLVSRVFFGGRFSTELFWVLLGGAVAFQILASQFDRFVGPRVREDGPAGRSIALAVRIWYAISPMRWIGPIQLTLGSNTTSARVSAAILLATLCLALGMTGVMFAQSGLFHVDSLTFFPESLREQGIDPRHYRDLRGDSARKSLYPSIQSDVVDDPFVKLFIPYSPRRHNTLIRDKCPEVKALKEAGFSFGRGEPPEEAAAKNVLECFATLFVIELDGEPVEDLDFDFTRDPGSSIDGIAAYISASRFEAGRHEVVVMMPPRHPTTDDGKPSDPVRHLIPFWL